MSNQKKIGKALSWSAIGRFGNLSIVFISNVILARILTPTEYGILGILLIFIGFSEVFIDGGLASALIQKNQPTDEEYSGVFYFNLIISIIFYILIFLGAPLIAVFFKDYQLIITLRVIGIVLIINSIGIIQTTQFQIRLSFKKLSIFQLISNSAGTLCAIILAYFDFGVWSLIYRNIVASLILNGCLWYFSSWRPQKTFQIKSILPLFTFGGYMFISTLFEYIYSYIQPVLIGKFFSLKELGDYSQARKLQEIPSNSFAGIVTSVAFPVLSKLKDNHNEFLKISKSFLIKISYIAFPIIFWMIICGRSFILVLFGVKWEAAIPLLQILAIAGLFRIPSALNMCVIQSYGKSKIFFITQIIKRGIGVLCILISLKYGILGLMWGFVIGSMFFFIVDASIVKSFIGYGIIHQIKDLLPIVLLIIISGSIVTIFSHFINIINIYFSFIISSFLYFFSYVMISYIIKFPPFLYYKKFMIKKFRKSI